MSKKLLFILTMCATSINVYSDESAATFILLNNYNIRQSVDVWSRMRAGFKLAHKQTSRVKYFEKFYTRNPKAFNQLMANARPYLYYILTQTERNGLPSEIALIPAVESSFNPLVSNPTDAYAGMWQFVPSTGKRFNLQQNENIDERRDIIKSTTSALNYLTYLHGIFGQWEATIGAYNWGEGNMYRAILKAGAPAGQIEYGDLHLRQITADYVPKIIALASIIENPAQFGVTLDDFDNQPYFAIVNPTAIASVNNIIQKVGLDNKTFTKLNPQFKDTDYLLGQADRILLPLANQNIYYAKQGGNLSKPTASLTSTLANPNLQVASNQLATSNQVANIQLTNANQGSAPTLTSQQDSKIQAGTPIGADTPATYHSDVITTTVANTNESGLDDLINNLTLTDNEPTNATAAVHTAVVSSHLKLIHHTVRAGDTLYSIAREYGANIDEIREENKIPGNNLVVGQVLSIRANCAASKPLPINS